MSKILDQIFGPRVSQGLNAPLGAIERTVPTPATLKQAPNETVPDIIVPPKDEDLGPMENIEKTSALKEVRDENSLIKEMNRLSSSARRVRKELNNNSKRQYKKNRGNEDFVFDDTSMPMGPSFTILPPYIQM